jgi:hypothetical protein
MLFCILIFKENMTKKAEDNIYTSCVLLAVSLSKAKSFEYILRRIALVQLIEILYRENFQILRFTQDDKKNGPFRMAAKGLLQERPSS